VTERQRYILRVRTLARGVAEAYYASREALGFPMLRGTGSVSASETVPVPDSVPGTEFPPEVA
jgi:hypothetical protein